MYYILKPILIPCLWLLALISFAISYVVVLIIVFKSISYSEYFSGPNEDGGYLESDNTPKDTFKRYWKGNIVRL